MSYGCLVARTRADCLGCSAAVDPYPDRVLGCLLALAILFDALSAWMPSLRAARAPLPGVAT